MIFIPGKSKEGDVNGLSHSAGSIVCDLRVVKTSSHISAWCTCTGLRVIKNTTIYSKYSFLSLFALIWGVTNKEVLRLNTWVVNMSYVQKQYYTTQCLKMSYARLVNHTEAKIMFSMCTTRCIAYRVCVEWPWVTMLQTQTPVAVRQWRIATFRDQDIWRIHEIRQQKRIKIMTCLQKYIYIFYVGKMHWGVYSWMAE